MPEASNRRLQNVTRLFIPYLFRRVLFFSREFRVKVVTVCGRRVVFVVVCERRYADQKVNQNGEERQRSQVTPAKPPVERRPLSYHELDIVHKIIDACKKKKTAQLSLPTIRRAAQSARKTRNANCYRIPRRRRPSRTRLKIR